MNNKAHNGNMLDRAKTGLLVVDIQEKFRPVIDRFDTVAVRAALLVRGFTLLNLPIVVTEQYPRGLGKTAEPLRQALNTIQPFEKMSLSCMRQSGFLERLRETAMESVVVCGIETHICVNQTVHDLLSNNFGVQVVTDATASRSDHDHQTALRKMELSGALPTTVEMCLFELLKTAGTEEFKQIQALIK